METQRIASAKRDMPPFRLFQNQVGEGLPLQRLQKFPLRGINPRNGLLRLAERTEPPAAARYKPVPSIG